MPATDDGGAQRVIAIKWIKNNILSAIIYSVISLFLDGLGYAIRGADADLFYAFSWVYYLAGIVLWTFAGIAEGVLTAAVLQRIVPFLPVRSWIALHAGIAAVLYLGFGAIGSAGSGSAASAEADRGVIVVGLIMAAVFGAIVGVAIG